MTFPRKLNILLLNSAIKWIGEAAHVFDLYRELRKAGHEVIFGCRRGYELEEIATDAGYEVAAFNFERGFAPLKDLQDVRQIHRIIRERNIDIVHCHRGKDHWLAAAAIPSRHARTALVRTRHVVTPAKDHLFNRWLYGQRNDFLFAVSQKALEGLGSLLPLVPQDKRRVIYSAVNLERFNPVHRSQRMRDELGVAEDDLLIGLIARFQNIKGQHIFLQAASILAPRYPGAKFLVAGRSTDTRRARYAKTVEEVNLSDRFIILGYRQDLPALIASMDIGVVASLGSEGSSRVSLEYLASGVPVVATTVGGIPELLQNGHYGILVEPNNARSLAEGIAQLLDDVSLRRQFSSEGRLYTETQKNYDRWIAELQQGYETAVRNKNLSS